MERYNVIVVGGGPAGVAAAVSAARLGEKVLLVEATNALGGAMNNMLVLPFMEYYTPIRNCPNPFELARGIFTEIVDKNIEMMRDLEGDSCYFARKPMAYFNEEYMKIVLSRMAKEAGVDLLYHARVLSADAKDNKINSIQVHVRGEVMTLEADTYIDCTGDAELAYRAGFPCRLGREGDNLCQPMTLCFRIANVDKGAFFKHENIKLMQQLYREAKLRGEVTNPREDVLIFNTAHPNIVHLNTTRVVMHNPTDPMELSDAEEIAREQVYEMFRFLRKYAPGCEKATLLSTASQIGIRESRMIEGEYTLTQEDLLACTKFDDGIAACNYDIDIHNPEGSGTTHYYFKDYTYYTIPYRCLVPKNSANLLVAGRCISSSHEAQASFRVIPYVTVIGEAAGVAAHIARQNGTTVKDAPVADIQAQLRRQGAFIEKEIPAEQIPLKND